MYRNVVYDVGGRDVQIHYLSDPEKLSFLVEALHTPHRAIEVYVEVGTSQPSMLSALQSIEHALSTEARVVAIRSHGVCDALFLEYHNVVRRYAGNYELNVGEVMERLESDDAELARLEVDEAQREQWVLERSRLSWVLQVTRARRERLGDTALSIFYFDAFVPDWVATLDELHSSRYDVLFMLHHASVVPQLCASRLRELLLSTRLDTWELVYTCIDVLLPTRSQIVVVRDSAYVQRMHEWFNMFGFAPHVCGECTERAQHARFIPDRFCGCVGQISMRGERSLLLELAVHSLPDRLPDPIDEFYRMCPAGY